MTSWTSCPEGCSTVPSESRLAPDHSLTPRSDHELCQGPMLSHELGTLLPGPRGLSHLHPTGSPSWPLTVPPLTLHLERCPHLPTATCVNTAHLQDHSKWHLAHAAPPVPPARHDSEASRTLALCPSISSEHLDPLQDPSTGARLDPVPPHIPLGIKPRPHPSRTEFPAPNSMSGPRQPRSLSPWR